MIRAVLLPTLLSWALAGCDNGVDPVFSRQALPPDIALLPADRVGVVVQPVSGVSEPFATAMATAVVAALQEQNIPASLRGGAAESYFLTGDTAMSRNGDGTMLLRLTWDLTAPDGSLVGTHDIREPMPPPNEQTGALLEAVAARSAPPLAALIQQGEPPPPVAIEVANASVAIGSIDGAPGSGAEELAAALAARLPMHGIAVDRSGSGGYSVAGEIALRAADAQTERVALRWRVRDADGQELGSLAQENDIPAGSLDGSWGEIAILIADGVASGVAEILQRAGR